MTSKFKVIIAIEIIIIFFLAVYIFLKKNNILGVKVSITPISKSNIQQVQFNNLKYFWDLGPNEVATWSASFLPKPVVNHYNNDGLNDTQNYSIDKPNNTYRIIALGDSFTYGQNVETKDNWTEILERKLNEKKICQNIDKFEILNLGVVGYDPTYEVARFEKTGEKYNADLIIWMLIDQFRLNEEKGDYFQKCLISNPGDPDSSCWKSSVKKTISHYGKKYIYTKQVETIKYLQSIFQKHILFVDTFNTHRKILSQINNGTIIGNFKTKQYLLKNNTGEEVLFPDGHFNQLGHQLMADILYAKIFEENQIPCQPLVQK